MKVFFNRFNRDKHFMTLLLFNDLERWIDDPYCQLLDEEKEALARAKDIIWETCGEGLSKRLDHAYCEALIKDLQQNAAVVERASKVVEPYIVCKQESADHLGDVALIMCNQQDRSLCVKYKKCKTYQAMIDANVPTCCVETDACPYRSDSYDKKTKKWTEVVMGMPTVKFPFKHSVCQQCGEVWYAEEGYPIEMYKRCGSCGGRLGDWL